MISNEIQYARLILTLSCMSTSYLFPKLFESMSELLIVLLISITVIPHGALDHIVYYQLYHDRYDSKKDSSLSIPKITFYFHYVAIMILWGLAWRYQIPLTFIVFLVLSAYHFGEGDLDYIQLDKTLQNILFLSRGSFILSLAILSKPDLTMGIVERFIKVPKTNLYSYQSILGIMITQHFLILALYGFLNRCFRSSQLNRFPVLRELPTIQVWRFEGLKAGLFYALFKSMNPLVAFCLYLGPWHSVGHMLSEICLLKIASNPSFELNKKVHWSDIGRFLYLTTPFTLIALSSMTGAYLLTFGLDQITLQDINAWSVFVISISVLTGPHLWVVAAMHSDKINLDPLNIESLMVYKTFGLG